MIFKFVTPNLQSAINDAESWQKNEGKYYTDELGMCMITKNSLCFTRESWKSRTENLISKGATSDDIDFWRNNSELHSRYKCILPCGHNGKCRFNINGLCDHNGLDLKMKDAVNNPGASGIFMNRAGAICSYPVMDKESGDSIKDSKITNVAVRLDRAATSYQVATALIDTLAMASLVENSNLKLDNEFQEMVHRHRNFLIQYHKDNTKVNIVDGDNFLHAPLLGKKFSIDQFGSGTGTNDYNSVQFFHIDPVCENRFMTRGLNVLFTTKEENARIAKDNIHRAIERMRLMSENYYG